MSWNKEYVIWQDENKTWNIGFYESYYYGGDDGDGEWDVEYYYDSFEWLSTGHSTVEEAKRAWDGGNPGGAQGVFIYSQENKPKIEELNAIAKKHRY